MITQTEVSSGPQRGLANFRLIPRIETYPTIVSFAQTSIGRMILLAAFALGLRYFAASFVAVLVFTGALALITFAPEFRRFVLAAVPLTLTIRLNLDQPLILGETLSVIGLGMGLYWCARRWPKSRFGRRPIVFLLSGFSALIIVACSISNDAALWSLVGVSVSYLWFIAYALADRSSIPAQDTTLQLASFRPLWSSTTTPFPKGAAYLRRIEAKTPEQLAITQLKGLKLLAWAILLAIFQTYWNRFFHGYLGIPFPDQALAMSVRGTPVAWHLRWESQILAYFELILAFSIMGHRIIACCRMAGFNALRNTYRPLSATTLIDFFNRFYYYFKELLVDFFYFPAFLRYFKKHRKLRTFFATFAAVAFGDSFYHLTRDWQFFRDRGLWGGLASYQVEFVYMIVLTVGLSISQMRRHKSRKRGFVRDRLVPICGVALFYIVISVFETDTRSFTLPQTFRYFASLFFIHY